MTLGTLTVQNTPINVNYLWAMPVMHTRVDCAWPRDNIEWSGARSNRVSTNTCTLDDPAWSHMRTHAQQSIDVYAQTILNIRTKFRITNSWLSCTQPGEHHHQHHHPNSVISGVIYLQTDPTHILFHGVPQMRSAWDFEHPVTDYTPTNSPTWREPVEQGDCVVFLSHVQHSTPTYTGTKPKIILGYNAFPQGTFTTDYAGDLEL